MVIDWVRRVASAILFLCIGCLMGVAFVQPLGLHLPDVYANLLGGIIGAVATIAGAFMVLNRQIRDADDRTQKEKADRDNRELAATAEVMHSAQEQRHKLQRAVAPALYTDLRTAKSICETQLSQAQAALGWAPDAKAMWCQRVAGIPMVAFDRLSHLLIHLGDLAPNLILVQAQAARLCSLVKGELDLPVRYREHTATVQTIADNLPTFINDLQIAMGRLAPFLAEDVDPHRPAASLHPIQNK